MSEQPEEVGAELFALARAERPPNGARERMLAAVRADLVRAPAKGRAGRAPAISLVLSALALAAGVALLLHRPETSGVIQAEPTSARETPSKAASASRSPLVPAPSAPAVPSARPAPSASAPPALAAPARSAPATLADETTALESAQTALANGDSKTALKALDHYDRELKGRELRDEATLLRIEALSRAGQAEAAAALAARFVAQNPQSPLVDRARSFVKGGKQ